MGIFKIHVDQKNTAPPKLLHKVIHSPFKRWGARWLGARGEPGAFAIIHNDAVLTLGLPKKELFCCPSFSPLDGPSGR
jgi:hypothetical protein